MQITEVITYGPFEAPLGTVVANTRVTFTEAAGAVYVVEVAPGSGAATSPTLPAGTYSVSAVAVDASGNAIGAAVSDPQTYTVTVPTTVTVQIPVSLTGSMA